MALLASELGTAEAEAGAGAEVEAAAACALAVAGDGSLTPPLAGAGAEAEVVAWALAIAGDGSLTPTCLCLSLSACRAMARDDAERGGDGGCLLPPVLPAGAATGGPTAWTTTV